MCAQHVNGAEPGYGSGQPSPLSEQPSSSGVLVVSYPSALSMDSSAMLKEALEPLIQKLGLKSVVLDRGGQARVQLDLTPLVDAIKAQTEAITDLAASNAALVEAIAQGDEEPAEDAIPRGMGKKQ